MTPAPLIGPIIFGRRNLNAVVVVVVDVEGIGVESEAVFLEAVEGSFDFFFLRKEVDIVLFRRRP